MRSLALAALILLAPAAFAGPLNPCLTNKRPVLKIGLQQFSAGDAVEVEQFVDESGYSAILLQFSSNGVRKFRAAQRGRVGKNLPICWGQELIMNPTLHEFLMGDFVHLSGLEKDVPDLAARLTRFFKLKPAG